MKFVVLIGDGMGDYPRHDLDGKTVLEAADTANMDWIAYHGKSGLAQTIPSAMNPGSDVANMEILGYDTTRIFTGRSVFEALSMGLHLGDNDVAFRANLVTLEDGVMKDYSAGHITTDESAELMKLLDKELGTEKLHFYPGVSYRNIMIWSGGKYLMNTTPPHDIIGKKIEQWLPEGENAGEITALMERSQKVLTDALVNKKRLTMGKLPANSIWLWGQGKRLEIPTIEEKYGLKGGVISAVDLIKGIGIAAGLKPVFVPGATGYIDTNFRGKAEAALETLETADFVYVHVEAPDEAAHNGDTDMKIKAIEDFDREVVGTVLTSLKEQDDLAVLVMCDHRTPLVKRTHTREPVPVAYYGPGISKDNITVFSERAAEHGSLKTIEGNKLMNLFIGDFISL
jgi:2,3-bisphosphoglycerate-independent phosphoglycerate mutase